MADSRGTELLSRWADWVRDKEVRDHEGRAVLVEETETRADDLYGIPRPITLVRHAGSGPLELLGEDALALSKLNWNNDALFDSLPVTIEYSKRLSQTIAHATSLPSGTYPYRLFM